MADFSLYNSAVEFIGDGTFDMDTATAGTWKAALVKGSYVADAGNTTWADITLAQLAENADANVVNLATVAWNRSTNTATFQADAVVFTASGGTMAADYVVVFQDGTVGTDYPQTSDNLLAYSNIGVQSIADTGTLTLQNSTGNTSQVVIFTQKIV
jgi:hypothetical protein